MGDILGVDEVTEGTIGFLKALLAEFIGNLLLNLFGCGACLNISSNLAIALAFGLAVFAAISAIGHVSGGHINPAVTASLASVGRVKLLRAILYIIVQCVGAAVGSGLLKGLTPKLARGTLGITRLGTKVSALQGFGVEFFLGFILLFVVCGVSGRNRSNSNPIAALAIGLTVTLGHLMALDYTGSSMNPARSFGSALVANRWAHHWVYWTGPVIGGIAAALLQQYVFSGSSDNFDD